MNIQNHFSAPNDVSASKPPERVAGAAVEAVASQSVLIAGSQDSAKVNHAAQLAEQAMQLPDVRIEKVNMIQNALAHGSYQVPAVDVADSMLRDMARRHTE